MDHVTPVIDFLLAVPMVAMAQRNTDALPKGLGQLVIMVELPCEPCLTEFEERFNSVVCQQGVNEPKRLEVVHAEVVGIEPSPLEFGNK